MTQGLSFKLLKTNFLIWRKPAALPATTLAIPEDAMRHARVWIARPAVARLLPGGRNPRTHTHRYAAQIAASISGLTGKRVLLDGTDCGIDWVASERPDLAACEGPATGTLDASPCKEDC
jgi:hypothetical protein